MDEKIVVRPPLWLWSGTVIFGLCGAYLSWMGLTSPKHMPTGGVLFFLLMGCVALFAAGYFTLYVGRERIEADTQGIRWRRAFHKWQGASWSEVSDFYDATGADHKQDHSVVRFQDGRKLTFNAYLEGFFALKNAITQRATATGKTEWESRDLKGDSTPTSALASVGTIAFLIANLTALSLCMGWMALWMPGEKLIRTGFPDVWGWATLITAEVLFLPLLILSAVGMAQLIRTERPRTVYFNEEGFRVEERGRVSWQTRWDEITAIKRYWNGKRIETPQGVFYATTALNHYRAFAEMMDANLPPRLKNFHEQEVPVVREGGTQVFRYVHSGYRGVLLFPLVIGILQPGVRLIYGVLDMEFRPNLTLTDCGIAGTLILIGIWGLWRMYATRIEISDSGITQVGLSGTTRLRWSDIERGRIIGSDMFAWCELGGAGRRVRWWAGLPNSKLLHEEITRRLPKYIPLDWKA